jgi:glycosyltransferase involved in cell wall biosynthesis
MGRDLVRINFLVNQVFDGWEPTDVRLGGTERAVVEWAEELANRGHTVWVFYNQRPASDPLKTNMGGHHHLNGVNYDSRDQYGVYPHWQTGVCINIKSPEVSPKEPTIFYTNDVDADKQDLSAYDGVIHISQWAKDNIPVNNPNVFIVPHGYDDKLIYPEKKIPKQCFYASSPDRGLDTLLEAWPSVMRAHPDATLLVTYGASRFFEPGAFNLPGIINLGEVTEEEMAEVYRTSDIWCHPCNGGELFCITGIKAQAAGCVPVIIPTMALAETVKYGMFSNKDDYADDLTKVLGDGYTNSMVREELAKYHFPTVADSTDELLKVIENVVK